MSTTRQEQGLAGKAGEFLIGNDRRHRVVWIWGNADHGQGNLARPRIEPRPFASCGALWNWESISSTPRIPTGPS